jgi:hypothetical protein
MVWGPVFYDSINVRDLEGGEDALRVGNVLAVICQKKFDADWAISVIQDRLPSSQKELMDGSRRNMNVSFCILNRW